MKADLSRNSHDASKRYTSVRLQQGRPQLDSDWNEQADIFQREIRERMFDATGDGAPAGPRENGFLITASGADLRIGAGRYYVSGVSVENFVETSIRAQPDLPGYTAPDAARAENDGVYLVYLEVRERVLSHLEDPALREVALGGPDTAVRTQTLGQVKLLRIAAAPEDLDRDSQPAEWLALMAGYGAGRLRASLVGGPPGTGEGFRLPENYLYRVEIHAGGPTGVATYKWSRNNASFAALWLDANDDVLVIKNSARDADQSFSPGQWIELIDEGRELRGEAGVFARVARTDGDLIIIDPASATGPFDIAAFPHGRRLVRPWDMTGAARRTTGESTLELEGGLQIAFDAPGGPDQYRPGDYWLIAARSVSKTIEWPRDTSGESLFQPPRNGPPLLSRLAFARLNGGVWSTIVDARTRFSTLADIARQDHFIENKLNRFGDTMTGTLNVEADLNVALDASFRRSLRVETDLHVKGDFLVEGDVIARDTQHEPGDVRLGDQDEDAITIHGTLKSDHSSGRLEIQDAASIAGDLNVGGGIFGGPAHFQGDATIDAGASIGGSVEIDDDLRVLGHLAFGPGATTDGEFRLDVDGDVRAGRFVGDGSLLSNVGNAPGFNALLPEYVYPTNDPLRHGATDGRGRLLFYTTIINRAPMLNPALGMFLGRRRILFDDFVVAPGERGPNGQIVYMLEGRDDLRWLGAAPRMGNDENGNRPILRALDGSLLEFSGYFHGVLPLFRCGPQDSGYRVRIDGGENHYIGRTSSGEAPNAGRYFDPISVFPERFQADGEPALHTILIAPENEWDAYGLEVIASRTSIIDDAGAALEVSNQIDVPGQKLLLNGEVTQLPGQSHDFRLDPWVHGYGLRKDGPGYYDEGLEAWEDYIPLAWITADHTGPQVFDPPLNIHDHVLNTTTGSVLRVKFFKNLVLDQHQAVSPDEIVWDEVCAIGRTVLDIKTRNDLIPNEIVFSEAGGRVYKVLATEDGSFSGSRFNRRRPLNGARVVWYAHRDAREDSGDARLLCAANWLPPRASALGSQQGLRGAGQVQLQEFQIDGEQYVVVANHFDANTYLLSSRLFRWEDEGLVQVQTFDTRGANIWKHFEIDGNHYLAVANFKAGNSHATTSSFYRWVDGRFEEQSDRAIQTQGAIDLDFFTIEGTHYLAVANYANTSLNAPMSQILRWNGTGFVSGAVPNVVTNYVRHMRHFEFDGEHFLGVTNQHDGSSANTLPHIHKWNGSAFELQSNAIPRVTYGGWGMHGFQIEGRYFLGISSFQRDGNRETLSWIYEWDGVAFHQFQEFATVGASQWRAFQIGTGHFLYLGSWDAGGDAVPLATIYRWTGARFVEFQKLPTGGGDEAAIFESAGITYLVTPALKNNYLNSYQTVATIYRWSGERFVVHEVHMERDERHLGQSRVMLDDRPPDYARSERSELIHAWEFGNGDKNGAATVFGGFDTLRNTSNRAFALDDGATALWARGVRAADRNAPAVRLDGIDDTLRLSFFGTGLRLRARQDRSMYGLGGRNADGWYALVSGLSYGTHTVEFRRTFDAPADEAATAHTSTLNTAVVIDGVEVARDQSGVVFEAFEIMQPRRPDLADDCVVIGEYTLLADPVQQTEGGPSVQIRGCRRQYASRELCFSEKKAGATGSEADVPWNYLEAPRPDDVGGIILQSGNVEKSVRYSLAFCGEGFVLRFRDASNLAPFTIRVDGEANLLDWTTNAPDGSLNPATGVYTPGLSGETAAAVSVLGLPHGEHTLEVAANTATNTYLYISAIDIVTPVHRAHHYTKHETPYLSEFTGGGAGIANEDLRIFQHESIRVAPLREVVARNRTKRPRVWSVVSKRDGYGAQPGNALVCDQIRGGAGATTGAAVQYGARGPVYSSHFGGWYIKEDGLYRIGLNFIGSPECFLTLHKNGELVYSTFALEVGGVGRSDSSNANPLLLRAGDVVHIRHQRGVMHFLYQNNQFSIEKVE